MKPSPKLHIVLFISLTICSSFYNVHAGFSVELIHRDSPKSPFFNPAETPYERLQKTLNRSIARVNHIAARINQEIDPNEPKLYAVDHGLDYILTLSLGTPPFEITGLMDTGTSLLWTQCAPCTSCFNQTTPMFDQSKSSTYQKVPCNARECKLVPGGKCDGYDTCSYEIKYDLLSTMSSVGQIGFDTFVVDTVSGGRLGFTGGLIGCGYKNDIPPVLQGSVSGIIGLGPGPVSIVNQMGDRAGGKFSYCLIPFGKVPDRNSIIHFGNSALSGPGTVTTPLDYDDNYYWVTLEGVSVGPNRIDSLSNINQASQVPVGNIMLDSSSAYTFVDKKMYDKIVKAVKEYTMASPDESGGRLCYHGDQFEAPPITIHFKGADVDLSVENTFIKVEEDLMCLAFKPSPSNLLRSGLYGTFMQMNFWVHFDLRNRELSFSRKVDCSQA